MSNQFSNQLIIRALFNQASQTQSPLILNNPKEYSSKFLIHDALKEHLMIKILTSDEWKTTKR